MATTAFAIRDSHPIDSAHAGRTMEKALTYSVTGLLYGCKSKIDDKNDVLIGMSFSLLYYYIRDYWILTSFLTVKLRVELIYSTFQINAKTHVNSLKNKEKPLFCKSFSNVNYSVKQA